MKLNEKGFTLIELMIIIAIIGILTVMVGAISNDDGPLPNDAPVDNSIVVGQR